MARYQACHFIMRADSKRYGRLQELLQNETIFKSDKYPKKVIDAFNMINSWKQDPQHLISVLGSVNDGVSFTTDGQRKDKSKLKCYGCGKLGHFEYECPDAKKEEDEPTNVANMLLTGVNDIEDDFCFITDEHNDTPSFISQIISFFNGIGQRKKTKRSKLRNVFSAMQNNVPLFSIFL